MTDRSAFLRSLGDGIVQTIARPDTAHAIFHGCYDWHSAVHGHWALLRLSRVLAEPRFAEAASAELTPERIVAEAQLLRDRTSFEMPYGRAWFLRLAIEHAVVTGGHALDGMANEVAQSLVENYDHVAPSPATREYANGSWAIAQLGAWARHTGSAALERWVAQTVADNFLDPEDVPGFDDDRAAYEFFSPRANWLYLVAHARPASLGHMLEAAGLDERSLAPVKVSGYAHHYGVNWSRAWMLHRLAILHPEHRLAREAFDAHVEVGLVDHARAAHDFMAYGHWVPQFAVYALTEDAA